MVGTPAGRQPAASPYKRCRLSDLRPQPWSSRLAVEPDPRLSFSRLPHSETPRVAPRGVSFLRTFGPPSAAASATARAGSAEPDPRSSGTSVTSSLSTPRPGRGIAPEYRGEGARGRKELGHMPPATASTASSSLSAQPDGSCRQKNNSSEGGVLQGRYRAPFRRVFDRPRPWCARLRHARLLLGETPSPPMWTFRGYIKH